MICLIDCNNFYASVETLFNPELKGKPVLILSNNDGCVVSRNNEAKALNIDMGIPVFKIKEEIKKHNIICMSSNYELYADMSNKLMLSLKEFSPKLEIYSIDEAFLDISHVPIKGLKQYCNYIKSNIEKNIGLPISIGTSYTKVLSKIASKKAKKDKRLGGVSILINNQEIEKTLNTTKVNSIWGIGNRTSQKLYKLGIFTALDLILYNNKKNLLKKITKTGMKIRNELNQIRCIELIDVQEKNKSMVFSRSLKKPLTTLKELEESISLFTTKLAEKLRKQKLNTKYITVFIKTSPFDENYFQSHYTLPLEEDCQDTIVLIKKALHILTNIFKQGFKYKKIGIIFNELSSENETQMNLLTNYNAIKSKKLMKSIDSINDRFGNLIIKPSSCGIAKPTLTHQNKKSPNYTTNWNQLLSI